MKLYDAAMAPNPRRVRMFLAEKGIQPEIVPVDIAAHATLSPEFLAINPRGLLPTLVLDDGTMLDESMAICRYVEAIRPEPNLFGRTPLEIATIERWSRRAEFDGFLSVANVFRNAVPRFAGRPVPGKWPEHAQIPALVERGKIMWAACADAMNERLGASPYLAGDRFTVADITLYAVVLFAEMARLPRNEHHADLARWQAQVAARPSADA